MSRITTILLHPFVAFKVSDDDGGGIDVVYVMTAFFAIGIWLVVKRYQWRHNRAVEFHINVPPEADPKWTNLKIENPSLHSHETDERFQNSFHDSMRKYITCYDPATALHIATVLADNADEISAKIAKATVAQQTWKYTTWAKRRRVIRSLNKWLVENQEACAKVACRDTGKTLVDAAFGEIITTCAKMEWLLQHGEHYLKPEKRHRTTILAYKNSAVHYDPLGVVAAIVSWNYPLHNAWSPILAALFAGNAVVLKCSEHVIWSTSWYIDIIKRCLEACGHDPELVQLVCCWPEDADALTKSSLIKHITFIGSEPVGRKIAVAATEHLTPVTLELGGKDPAIILQDTDLKKWESLWMRGVFQNAGQNCIGIERFIVHTSQYDALWEIFQARVQALRLGAVMAPTDEGYVTPVDCGAMISGDRFGGLAKLLQDAEESGAQVEGGKQYSQIYHPNGTYFRPAVVGPVAPESEIAQTELFAPIALLIQYDDIEEAINIANGTRYGLGASVFGPDQEQCIKVAKQLECGMVSVNDFGVFYLNQDLPFGGTKYSGYGRFGGPEGLRALTNPKAIIVDRWPSFIQTGIPRVLDYPIRSLSSSWEYTTGLVRFLYADGWRARIRGLKTVIQAGRK